MSSYLDQNGTQYLWGKIKTWVGNQGYLKTHQTVTDASPTLSWGATSKVATIGNTDIHVTMPAKPSYNFSDIGSKPTTLAGYGITDAKIDSGTITLGSNSITPLTSHQDISGKVNKNGDTMSGNLTISRNSSYLYLKNSTYTLNKTSNNGASSGNNYGAVCFKGKDDQVTGYCVNQNSSSGVVSTGIRATNMKSDGTTVTNIFEVQVKKDGSTTYSVTNASNFRSAISAPYMYTDTYPTLQQPGGGNSWIKIGTSNTSYGLLPSASGGIGSGHNYIGTSSWYWKYSYIDEMYCNNLHYNAMNTLVELCTWGTYADTGTTVTLKEAVTNYHFIVIRVGSDTDAGTTTVGGMQFIYLPSSANLTGNQINILFAQQSNLQAMKCSFPSTTSFKILGRKTLVGSGWYAGVRCIYGLWKK